MAKKDPAKEAIVRQINSLAGESVIDSELRNLSVAELQTIADAVSGMNPNTIPAPILAKIPKSDGIILNSANRVATNRENQERSELIKVQTAEVQGLKAEGAPQSVIDAVTKENATELSKVRTDQKATGYQAVVPTIQIGDNTYTTSSRNEFGTDASAQRVITALDAGYGLLNDFGLEQHRMEGKSTIGMNLYGLGIASQTQNADGTFVVDPRIVGLSDSPRTATNTINYLNAISAEQANPTLSNSAKVIGGGVDRDGNRYEVVTDTISTGIKGAAEGIFNRYSDGRVDYVGASTSVTPTDRSFWDTWGPLIVGVAGGFLLGPTANFLATGSTAAGATLGSTIGAGALLGAGGALLTGGDPFLGALTGGIGGGFASYIGSYGGLGSYLARNGVDLSVDAIGLLNNVVPGIGGATAPITDLSTSLLDDAAVASAQNAITAGAAAGLLDEVTAANLNTGVANLRLTQSQIEDFIPTPTGAGTIPTPAVVPGSGLVNTGTGAGFNPNSMGSGFNINPEDFIPTPVGGGSLPPPSTTTIGIDSYIPPPVGAGTLPVVPNPNPNVQPSLLDDAISAGRGAIDDIIDYARQNPLQAAGIGASIIGALNQTPVSTGVGDNKLPAWVFDPAMSGVIPRIQAAQAAIPRPMPNLFNAQFQRGGLGAGQFIGYDLLNRTGDIPQQTLLGVSPLAMPPLNLLGVTGGQVPASQTSLVG